MFNFGFTVCEISSWVVYKIILRKLGGNDVGGKGTLEMIFFCYYDIICIVLFYKSSSNLQFHSLE